MTVTYKTYTIEVKAHAFDGGFTALVLQGTTLFETVTGPSEAEALAAAKTFVDSLADYSQPLAPSALPVPIADGGTAAATAAAALANLGGVDAAGGAFTGQVDFAATGIRWLSGSNVFHVRCQDGTGRVLFYWNSTTGTSPTFIVGGEDALKLAMTSGGALVWYWSPGAGKIAGDSITWYELLRINSAQLDIRAGGASGHAVNRVRVNGDDTGSPVEVAAVGGDANIDLKLTPAGTGVLQLGSPATANGVTPPSVSHTLPVKDENGNTYYLMLTDDPNPSEGA